MKQLLLVSLFALLFGMTPCRTVEAQTTPHRSELSRTNDTFIKMNVVRQDYNLPFTENWNSGAYETQGWTFDNFIENWQLWQSGSEAYVRFMYSPRTYNYTSSLISPLINIAGAGNLSLSFDFSASTYLTNGTEHFKVFVLNNGNWVQVASYANTAEIDLQTLTFELGTLQGSQTRIRFEASGQDTDRINHWVIDNIVLQTASSGSPVFALNPLSHNFGEVNVGSTSATANFTLSNTGTAAGTVSSIAIAGAQAAEFSILNLPALPLTIDPNQSVSIQVVFNPAQAGVRNANLQIAANNGNLSAELTGTGKTVMSFNLPFTENWNSGAYETQGWTFDNFIENWQLWQSGSEAYVRFMYSPRTYNYTSSLISPLINIAGAGNLSLSFDFSASTYLTNGTEHFKVFVLNNGNWVQVASYANTAEIDLQTLTFELGTLQGSQTRIRFEASGQDTDRINHWVIDNIVLQTASSGSPVFALNPLSHNFGEVNVGSTSATANFTLSNTGTAAGTVSSIAIAGAQAAEFSILNLPALPLALDPDQSLDIQLAFNPAQAGVRNANLIIQTSVGDITAQLSGTGAMIMVFDLPFVENWNSGAYETQGWTFDNFIENWQLFQDGPNQAYVRFMYSPRTYNYTSSLISPLINIAGAGNLSLSFDFSASTYLASGTEHFKVFVLNNGSWMEVVSYSNTGEIDLQTLTFELETLQGTQTRIRFEASGQDTDRINHWVIDNIVLQTASSGSPVFALNPLSHNFGEVNVGSTSATANFTLSNTGTAAGTVSSIAIAGAQAAEFSILNLPALPLTIDPNQSVSIQVVFNPTQAGMRNAVLQIATNNENLSAELSGTGKTVVAYNLPFTENWNSGAFETQGWTFDNFIGNWQLWQSGSEAYVRFMYSPRTYNYTSSLISPLINIAGAGNLSLSFDFSASTYLASGTEHFKVFVLNNGSWMEVVSYSNTGEIDLQTLTFELETLQGTQTRIRFEASGQDTDRINHWVIDNIVLNGTALQSFELTPALVDFGPQMTGTVSAPHTFTYANTGLQPVIVTETAITGSHASSFVLDDAQQYPLTLEAGQSKQVQVRFAPQAAGSANASLTVITQAGDYHSELQGLGFAEFIGSVPFIENWSSASFETQQWTFDQPQTNWRIQANSGNPAPTARFNFSPIATNYSYSLISPRIQVPSSSQSLALSFDLKLTDFQPGNTEWLKVHVWNGQSWQQISAVSNNGNTAWVSYQYNISENIGQEIKLKFEATGQNSGFISSWDLDNISLQFMDWPTINITPTELVQVLTNMGTATDQVLIGNEGTGNLNFTTNVIYDASSGNVSWLGLEPSAGTVVAGQQLPVVATFNTDGLEGMGSYFSATIAFNSNDPQQPVVNVQAFLTILLSLDNISIGQIKVYPVPATEVLYCKGVETIKNVQIFNTNGQCVFELNPRGRDIVHINTSSLTNGSYLLKLFPASGKPIKQTIIINH